MSVRAQEVRRWIAGFEAAAAADRDAARGTPGEPDRAFGLALALIAEARRALAANPRLEARRSREDDAARRVWARLRERLRP